MLERLFGKHLVHRERVMLGRIDSAVKSVFSFKNGTIFKRIIAAAVIICEALGALLFSYPQTPRGQAINIDEWEVVWSDEFDGNELDLTKWNPSEDGVRRGGYWDIGQASVENGKLTIRTQYLEKGEKSGWYSAAIETRDSHQQKYGYWECSAVCAPGEGLWSAFWTFAHGIGHVDGSGRDGAEIDIFESPNYANPSKKIRNSVTQTVHYDGYGESHVMTMLGNYSVKNPYSEFNTYGMEWTPDELIFYVNRVETDRLSGENVPQVAEWIILSTEVNGTGGTPGLSNDGTIDGGSNGIITNNGGNGFVSDFVVDYVRIYEKK